MQTSTGLPMVKRNWLFEALAVIVGVFVEVPVGNISNSLQLIRLAFLPPAGRL